MKLLDEVLAAYGGLERWKKLHTIKIHQIVGGALWPLKNVDGVINDSTVEIRVQEQRAWHRPFTQPGARSLGRGRSRMASARGALPREHRYPQRRPGAVRRLRRTSAAQGL